MLPSYDYVLEDDSVISRRRPPAHDPHAGPHARVDVLPARGLTGAVLRRHPVPGGPGNTKFPGGDFETIIESIDRRLFTLPDDTLVMPGHGDDTTIGNERPHLQEWIDRGW